MSPPTEPDLLRCALPAPDPDHVADLRKPFRWHAALEGLRLARKKPKFAGPTLAKWFREQRSMGSRDRRVVQRAIYGIIRQELLFLRAGARGDEDQLEHWCAVLEGERFAHLENGTPAEDFATALSLGYRIASEWLDALGPVEAARFAQLQTHRAPLMVRANLLRCTRDELQARLKEEGVETTPCAIAAHGLELQERANVQALASFREGWMEVQDGSSQAFVDALPLTAGQTAFDLCAGAGGKSLALAAQGLDVWANDIRPKALSELRRRAERAGAGVTMGEPEDQVDIAIVDAPCSGTGRLRREPTLRWGLEQDSLLDVQAELLSDAATWVRPGGHLAYATCSLLAAENDPALPEEMAEWPLVEARMIWPQEHGTDGFGWRIWRCPE